MNNEEKRILYYECKRCGTKILPNTGKVMVGCKCGKFAIDGSEYYTRILGNSAYIKEVKEEQKPAFVYRVRIVETGLFYAGSWTSPNRTGKFYSRVPSLKWPGVKRLASMYGECVIDKYSVELVDVKLAM